MENVPNVSTTPETIRSNKKNKALLELMHKKIEQKLRGIKKTVRSEEQSVYFSNALVFYLTVSASSWYFLFFGLNFMYTVDLIKKITFFFWPGRDFCSWRQK